MNIESFENEVFVIDEEEEIQRELRQLKYPAATLCSPLGVTPSIIFNASTEAYLTGPFITVSCGNIRGDKYLCFHNAPNSTESTRTLTRMTNGSSRIAAAGILNFLGLRGTKYTFRARQLVRIKDGVAVKLYEQKAPLPKLQLRQGQRKTITSLIKGTRERKCQVEKIPEPRLEPPKPIDWRRDEIYELPEEEFAAIVRRRLLARKDKTNERTQLV